MLRLQSLFCFLFATIPLAGVEAVSITMTIPKATTAATTGTTYVSEVSNAGDIKEGSDVLLKQNDVSLTLVVSGSSLDTDKINTHCVTNVQAANPNTLLESDGVLTITCKGGNAPSVTITLTQVEFVGAITVSSNLAVGTYVPSIANAGTAVAHPSILKDVTIATATTTLNGLTAVGKTSDTGKIKTACITKVTVGSTDTSPTNDPVSSASVITISCDTADITSVDGLTITLTPRVSLPISVTSLAAGVFLPTVTNAGGITKAGQVVIIVGDPDFDLVVVGPDTETGTINTHCVANANVEGKANKLLNTPLVNTPGVQDITCGGGNANDPKVTIKLQPVTTEADIVVKVSGLVAGKYTPTLTNAGNIKESLEVTLGAGSLALGSVTISVTAMAGDIATIKKHCVDSVAVTENKLAVVSGVVTITCHGGTTNVNNKVKITLTPVATTTTTTTAGAFQAIPSVFAIMAVVFAMSVM